MVEKVRKELLMKIYKECFKNPVLRIELFHSWNGIYKLLQMGEEDKIPTVALAMVVGWINERKIK